MVRLSRAVLAELEALDKLPKAHPKKARKVRVLTRTGYSVGKAIEILKARGDI